MKYFKIFIRSFLICLCILGVLSAALLIGTFYPKYREYTKEAKEVIAEKGDDIFYNPPDGHIYDDEGKVIKTLSQQKRIKYLDYEDIPTDVINAFIAIEDRKFWSHPGVDLKGLVRVLKNYILSGGEEKHGASTITQQLVRNTYISKEVTIERKLKEICYALELEKVYSKKEIMEFYINNVYYSNGYYSIESAAKGYFGVSAAELTLSQTAYLCAVPNSPTYYDPVKNPGNALKRRDKILKDMYELDYINTIEYKQALGEEIVLNRTQTRPAELQDQYGISYAVDCAARYFMKESGFVFQYSFSGTQDYKDYLERYNESYEEAKEEVYKGGYEIHTSLNKEMQEILQNSIDETLSFDTEVSGDGVYKLQSSATCIDNETGLVVAISGGRTQEGTYLNRAYQSYRQPGSSLKPLVVYAPALESGYGRNSQLINASIETYNKTKEMSGSPVPLQTAVEKSLNGAAWSLFNEITPKKGLSYLQNMQFAKIVPDDFYLSASLGGLTYGVTTAEMANGYSTLANNGLYREATCITSITDKDGNEIYKKPEGKQVYDEFAASEMVDIMKGVITSGTARSMGWSSKTEAAGKTGTTNDNKDGWFCGITPYYTVSVWVGYDIPQTLSDLYGSSYPARIWRKAMEEYVKELPARSFDKVEGEPSDPMAGMDDTMELSDGYTVGDYRKDQALAQEAEAIIGQMSGIDKGSDDWRTQLNMLFNSANMKIQGIYGQTLKAEMTDKLNAAYQSASQ